MTISKKDIEQLVNLDMDEGARDAFLSMVREEQLLAILGMQAFIRTELATVKKDQIEFRQDLGAFKRELREVRAQREEKEKTSGDQITDITDKIVKTIDNALAKRFDFWTWFRDRILPTLATGFILGLLYLVFGGKLP